MDRATWIGLLLGVGAILLGNLIEGGHVNSLLQLTAFIIVLGGTVGAVMVSNSWKNLEKGISLFKTAFVESDQDHLRKTISEIVDLARIAKRDNLMALEPQVNRIKDPILYGIIRNKIDGIDLKQISDMAEAQIESEQHTNMAGAKVWMDAGGYAPTIGIIGAVLGLIHVMGNLSDTSQLGAGIAVAFVATVYGVCFANLIFLPIGNKIKRRIEEDTRVKRILLEGALLVGEELSPLLIEQKLKAHLYGD